MLNKTDILLMHIFYDNYLTDKELHCQVSDSLAYLIDKGFIHTDEHGNMILNWQGVGELKRRQVIK